MLETGRTEGWTRGELIAAEVRIWGQYEGLVDAMKRVPEAVQELMNPDQRNDSDDRAATGSDYDESITPPSGVEPDDQSSTKGKGVIVCPRDE